MKKVFPYLSGLVIGLVNGFFGAAGGIVAVELLKKNNIGQKKAHATSLAIILSISIVTVITYALNGKISLTASYKYIIGGIVGTFLGVKLLNKIPNKILKKIFSGLIIFCGVRMLFK